MKPKRYERCIYLALIPAVVSLWIVHPAMLVLIALCLAGFVLDYWTMHQVTLTDDARETAYAEQDQAVFLVASLRSARAQERARRLWLIQ